MGGFRGSIAWILCQSRALFALPVGAELPAAADLCDRCGASTSGDHQEVAERPLRDRPWVMTILLLHLGVFGIPLYWKASYSRNTRILVVILSIVYTLLVVVVVIWGCMQMYRLVELGLSAAMSLLGIRCSALSIGDKSVHCCQMFC